MTVDNIKDYLWLVKTTKGDFFITVVGNWTEAEAARNVLRVFGKIKLDITGMIPRKRVTGPEDAMGTIYQPAEPGDDLGFSFLAGKNLWSAIGRGAEYEAEVILLKKEG